MTSDDRVAAEATPAIRDQSPDHPAAEAVRRLVAEVHKLATAFHVDDGEPVSGEWLVSIGFTPAPYYPGAWHLTYDTTGRLTVHGTTVLVGRPDHDALYPTDVPLCRVRTRGDVRRLLSALGVTTTEELTCATT